jgi:hypothetical protein
MGFRYVAVRGIFPLKEQVDKLAQALRESSYAKASDMFELIDFELERQAAAAGPDPWSEPWKKVDVKYALKVLKNVDDFDSEVVDSGLTDAVITMPLPRRVAGFWGNRASHPRIAELSEEQREEQRLLEEKILAEYRKKLEEQQKTQPIQKGGFAGQIENVREIRKDVLGGAGGQQLLQKIRQDTKATSASASLTIVGRLLLFRFFDFTVEPGNAYRYRVRLVVRNPNFQRPIEQLMDKDYALGETRTTTWSQPSDVAVVERDVEYYITAVNPPRGPAEVSANINVYQWYQEAGTTVKGELAKLQVGQLIEGYTRTDVLRPATETFEPEDDVHIATGDVLVDIKDTPLLDPKEHTDLQIESRKGIQVAEQILTVDRNGELKLLDTVSSKSGDNRAQTSLNREREPWGYIKDRMKATENETALDKELKKRKGNSASDDKSKRPVNPAKK